MNGERIAELLEIHNNGIRNNLFLSDDELNELIEGIRFLYEFNLRKNFSPETLYYGSISESLERMQSARKEK